MRTTAGTSSTPPQEERAPARHRDKQGVDLDELILHNKMDGQLLNGRSRLKQGTEIWLPDEPDISFSSSDSEEDSERHEAPP